MSKEDKPSEQPADWKAFTNLGDFPPMSKEDQPNRVPLLSDEAILAEVDPYSPDELLISESSEIVGAKWARDFYEAKITSGELMVVKTVKPEITPFRHVSGAVYPEVLCPECGTTIAPYGVGSGHNRFNFCPGCGAKIIP